MASGNMPFLTTRTEADEQAGAALACVIISRLTGNRNGSRLQKSANPPLPHFPAHS